MDGGLHLHAYIRFKEKLRTRNIRFFDIDGHHPNIKVPEKPIACIKYCSKEGYNVFTHHMDIKQEIQAHESKKRILGQRLIDGEAPYEVVKDYPEMIFGYKKLKQDVEEYQIDKAKAYEAGGSRGLWCVGPIHSGKSHFVRAKTKELYNESVYLKH